MLLRQSSPIALFVGAAVLFAGTAGLFAGTAEAQTTWTVDDDGPADFADLQSAVDAAVAGDRILISSGSYGSAVVDKELTLSGRKDEARPQLNTLSATSIASLSLSHLDLLHGSIANLSLSSIPGRTLLSDVTVVGGAVFSDCADVVVTRSLLEGADRQIAGLSAALLSNGSRAQFVASELHGGRGHSSIDTAGDGGDALVVGAGCHALLAGTSVQGGNGEPGQAIFGGEEGIGGTGIEVAGSADLRGTRVNRIAGGKDGDTGDFDGPSIAVAAGATATFGGVSLRGGTVGNVAKHFPPDPFLTVSGDALPGSMQTLSIYGREGTQAWVLASLAPASFFLPSVASVPVSLDPAAAVLLVPLALQGSVFPAQTSWTLPASPALAGRILYVQGFQGSSPGGGFVATNVEAVPLGP